MGGKRHGEREGLRTMAPFWFILNDSATTSATVNQTKKCF